MRTLFVVIHPEAAHHVEHLVGGWYDSDLTPAGLGDAQSVGAALRARIPDEARVELYSSDLRRTHQTAQAIADRLHVDVVLDQGLREKSYGVAEGKPQQWLDERFIAPPAYGDRMHHDEGITGSETRWSLGHRVYASMDRIIAGDCEHQIVVTHGFAHTFVVSSWIGMPLDAAGSVAFRSVPGGITELTQDDFFHNRQVTRLSDDRHLTRSSRS